MRAVIITETGSPDVLTLTELDHPAVEKGKIQINIKAVGLNHLDLWVRSGLPGAHFPLVMGSDGAGVITAVGEGVIGISVGDEVVVQPGTFCGTCKSCLSGNENLCANYGIIGEDQPGLLQEYVNLSPQNVFPKPPALNWAEAASFGLVFLTSYQMLMNRAKLQSGETVLVLGGSSGVGAAAIQIAKAQGARVVATASAGEKSDFARRMGADEVVDHYSDDWHQQVLTFVGEGKVDVVIEHVGAATWPLSMRVLADGGRIVVCGATTGPNVEIELRHIFRKQQSILGSTMGTISAFKAVLDRFTSGDYRPIVDRVFPLAEIRAAHTYLEQGKQVGKVVISLESA